MPNTGDTPEEFDEPEEHETEYTHRYEESREDVRQPSYGSGGLRTPMDARNPFAGGVPAVPGPGSGSAWDRSPGGTMEGPYGPESPLPSQNASHADLGGAGGGGEPKFV
jgi:hypothetical protein